MYLQFWKKGQYLVSRRNNVNQGISQLATKHKSRNKFVGKRNNVNQGISWLKSQNQTMKPKDNQI